MLVPIFVKSPQIKLGELKEPTQSHLVFVMLLFLATNFNVMWLRYKNPDKLQLVPLENTEPLTAPCLLTSNITQSSAKVGSVKLVINHAVFFITAVENLKAGLSFASRHSGQTSKLQGTQDTMPSLNSAQQSHLNPSLSGLFFKGWPLTSLAHVIVVTHFKQIQNSLHSSPSVSSY